MSDLVLIGIRFALFADLMLIVGIAAFALYALGGDERRRPDIVSGLWRTARWLCAFGLLISFLGMGVLTANMHGVGLFALDPAMILAMARDTDVGAAWLYRMIALLIASVAALSLAKRPTAAAVTLVAAGSIALATLAWSGHAGATEGAAGTLHRASDALHLIAAGVWLGAIAAFLLLLRAPRDGVWTNLYVAARSLDQFSKVGTICVLVIAATGLFNSQMIIGVENIGRSLAAPYGQLLAAKLALFGLMLALAAVHRWRLTPALARSLVDSGADPRQAVGAMRRSLFLEASAAAAILALVAWFGTLEPFASPGMA